MLPEEVIADLLVQSGRKLALAESCTGGLVGHRITNVPGSSAYYLGGVTAYSYEAKMRLIGVRPATLDLYGAVSSETVLEMAAGACKVFDADAGLAISGIAGPDGGTAQKPVGLVYFAFHSVGTRSAVSQVFEGNRIAVKEQAAEFALNWLAERLREG
ncbi:MAG: CinA family protein [Chloroflexi bacterium]|nr:CinA family protein [Chloroflexota bacterium]